MLNYIFDEELCELIHLGIDLKEYFESNLTVTEINHPNFPSLHKND